MYLAQHIRHPPFPSQETYAQSPDDCVMLVKRYVNSEELSQAPFVLLPACWRDRLKKGLETNPRNLITDRAKKEHLGFNIKFLTIIKRHLEHIPL